MKAPPSPHRTLRSPVGLARLAVATAATGLLPPTARAEITLLLEGGSVSDRRESPHLALHVDTGNTPSPWIPAGTFTATWEGNLSVDLRGDFQFRLEATGPFSLEIAGTNLTASPGPPSDTTTNVWSAPVRLRKGPNAFRAVFRAGDTRRAPQSARLFWQGRGLPPGPVPTSALSLVATNETPAPGTRPSNRDRGRALFLELRCGRCHTAETPTPVPELAMEAPALEKIGPGRDPDWLARWLLDPQGTRTGSTMPRLLLGPQAGQEAKAVAAWLTSRPGAAPAEAPPAGAAAVGKALAESLRCAGCHVLPGEPADPTRVSLEAVASKFRGQPATLIRYLERPSDIDAWSRMPDFGFTREEAAHLAAWLLPPATTPAPTETPGNKLIEQGAALVESRGCRACHGSPAIRPPKAPSLATLTFTRESGGCLSDAPSSSPPPPGMPAYGLSGEQKADLKAFAQGDPGSLGRHVPTEFAERWMKNLRCGACHDAGITGFPPLAGAGAKLRPEWTQRLLHGDLTRKSRPWLPARMPAFPAYASGLAPGLAALHGLPARPPLDPPIDEAAAADGRKLVSASGGFACVSCHAIGASGATAVFEAPGINFTLVADRLQPEYFGRWIRNPQLVEPGTKMPQYFDEEGNSALADYAGGDGPKTVHALWNYLRLGSRMEPPPP